MVEVVVDSGVECCLMHMLGEPRTMQREPHYKDVVDDVKAFLEERLSFAVGSGVREERIMLDPGIGFGKTLEHNLELLGRLEELTTLGRPLVVGTSRKGFLGRIIADADADADADAAGEAEPVGTARRLPGTIATNVLALERGASVFRVHDVAPVRDALAVAAATLDTRWTARGTTTQTS
jgi:dihydropteroate synthase